MKEYIYVKNNCINVIQLKPSQNSKLGYGIIIGTYHFSIEQVEKLSLKYDKDNCFECPYSYNSGSGKCYTHKGLQRLGLNSMLKRLNKLFNQNQIKNYDFEIYQNFISNISKIDISITRFGVYGEPIMLDLFIIEDLIKLSKNYTGYTHQWNEKNKIYSKYFMASTHSYLENRVAKSLGFRTFQTETKQGINCPASIESGKKTTCINCALCSGSMGKGKTDIYISEH